MSRPVKDEDEVEVEFKSLSGKYQRFTANQEQTVGDKVFELSARTGHPFIGLLVSMYGVTVHLQMTIKEASQLHELLHMFNSYLEDDEADKEKFALHFEAELNKVLKKLALTRRQGKSLCFEKLYALFEHQSPKDESTVRSITFDVIEYDVSIPKGLFENEYLMWKLLRQLLELRGNVKSGTIDQVLYFEKGSPFVGKTLKQVARVEQSQIRTIMEDVFFKEWCQTKKAEYKQLGFGESGRPWRRVLYMTFNNGLKSKSTLGEKNVELDVRDGRCFLRVPAPLNLSENRKSPYGFLKEAISKGETIHAIEPEPGGNTLLRSKRVAVLKRFREIPVASKVVTTLLEIDNPQHLERALSCQQWLFECECDFHPFENEESALLSAFQKLGTQQQEEGSC